MEFEPTILPAAGPAVAETLKNDYEIDPAPVFREAGLDASYMETTSARIPRTKLQAVFDAAVRRTGDPCIGLAIGNKVRPTSWHALGISLLACKTLADSLSRFGRFAKVVSTTSVDVQFTETNEHYLLTYDFLDPRYPPSVVGMDAFNMSVVRFCQMATTDQFHPKAISMTHEDFGQRERYVRAFGAPVEFGAASNTMYFDKTSLEAPLPGHNADLCAASNTIAERYIQSLEPDRVTSEVRQLLLDILPTGEFTQETIASRLNRSPSTLRRQLQNEGTSFQQIREDTRRTLAMDYIRKGELSIGEVAFMLGFSDQSNFSRAFKRWTGSTPRNYQLHS